MKNFLYSLILILAFANTAFALSLDEAKAKGLVGEKPDGYLGAVAASPEVDSLVSDINSKRRAKYQEIAKKNGASIQSVEVLAGEKAIENTAKGQYVQDNGAWRKK